MADDFILNTVEILKLGANPYVVRAIERQVQELTDELQLAAPKDTGKGAASIHAELIIDKAEWRVGWDPQHFYLGFHELGTVDMPARPFVRPVVDRLTS